MVQLEEVDQAGLLVLGVVSGSNEPAYFEVLRVGQLPYGPTTAVTTSPSFSEPTVLIKSLIDTSLALSPAKVEDHSI